MSWATVIVGVASIGAGIWQNQSAKKEQKKLQKQMTSFKTSEYAYDMNEMAQSMAQNGFDAPTLAYMTNQIGRQTSNSADTVQRLGGGPNAVSEVLDQGLEATFRLGAENSNRQFENYNRYLNTLANLDQNLGAQWASQQMLLKDQKQAAYQQQQAGNQNIMAGVNTGLQGYANYQQQNLYNDQLAQLAEMMNGSAYPSVKLQGQNYTTTNANNIAAIQSATSQPGFGTAPASVANLQPTKLN